MYCICLVIYKGGIIQIKLSRFRDLFIYSTFLSVYVPNRAFMLCDTDRWHVLLFLYVSDSSWAMAGGSNIHFILIIPQITPSNLKSAPGKIYM